MRSLPLATLLVLALPAVALAQTPGTSSTIGASTRTIAQTDCNNDDSILFTVTLVDTAGNVIPSFTNTALWVFWNSPSAACTETTPTTQQLLSDTSVMNVGSATSGVYTVSIPEQDIVGAVQGGGTATCGGTSGFSGTGQICFRYSGTLIPTSPISISIDTVPIEAPSLTGAQSGDNTVRLSVSAPPNATPTGYRVFFRVASCPGGTGGAGGSGGSGAGGSGGVTSAAAGTEICGNGVDDNGDGLVDCADPLCAGQIRDTGGTADVNQFTQFTPDFGAISTLPLTGLTNNVEYQFTAEALRDSDVSPPSNVILGTPLQTLDFWDQYKAAGGAENGGCSSSRGELAFLGAAVLAALFLLPRRGRSR